MSLRTKLLAAVVGLPGAIVLLAIALFLMAEPPTPAKSIDNIVHLANGHNREAVGPGLLAELRADRFERAFVVKSPGLDPEAHPPQAWTAQAFFEQGVVEPDVTDADLLKRLADRLEHAKRMRPTFVLRQEYLAVVVITGRTAKPSADLQYDGLVVELLSPRVGAETVYWVLIAGIALMMVISYWLITRLVIRPLAGLAAAADRIAGGDYQVTLEGPDRGDEFGRTARALNRMAREIAEYQGHLEDRVLTALGRIKRAERHLVIAQRLAATGKLASGLAHEINNPLGGMKNAVRALARGDLPAERTRLYLDLVTDGLARIEQTVKKFLTFTPRNVEPRPADLAEVAEKSIALAAHRIRKKGIEVQTRFPDPGQAIVFGDPHELQQVALNLILNAVDAIGERDGGHIEVAVEAGNEEVVLRVRDDGTGMSHEDQGHCFDMFFTTKAVGEGSGMGLAVVHHIVTNHGGRIDLVSELGQGTTFQVVLPAASAGSGPEGSEG